jgi:hypothetical protein
LTTATISLAGEVDIYSFDGELGEVVELTLVQTAGFAGTIAHGTLIAPSGAIVDTFNANSLTEVILPETGAASTGNPYKVEIQANNLVATGTYNFGLERRQSSAGPATADPQSPPLACGQLISASISQAGEVDYFRFEGSLDDIVEFTLVETSNWGGSSGSVDARMTIFPPDPLGTPFGPFDSNALEEITLPETGEYLVRVTANNLVTTGSYNLGFECRFPLGPVEQHLVCGDLVSDSIAVAGEVDYFTFDGTQDDIVELTLVETSDWGGTSGWVDARMTIFPPDPLAAPFGPFDSNTLQELTLPETGLYRVRVHSNNLPSGGSYNIGLNCP